MRGLDLPLGYRALSLRAPMLPTGGHINCYIVGHVNALIVDPGSPYGPELDRLREHLWHLRGSGGTLAAVFLTHHHRDHVAGATTIAKEFDLPVAAHLHTLATLRVQAAAHGRVTDLLQVGDADCFELDDGRRLQVLHTPGHTSGHCCLFEPTGSVLLCGDMMRGDGGSTFVDPVEGDMGCYLESLARLQRLSPRWTLAGHGPTRRSGGVEISRLMTHRQRREDQIAEELTRAGEPVSLAVLATRVYGPLTLAGYGLAMRSVHAHLIKLQRDGKVHRSTHSLWFAVEQQ